MEVKALADLQLAKTAKPDAGDSDMEKDPAPAAAANNSLKQQE